MRKFLKKLLQIVVSIVGMGFFIAKADSPGMERLIYSFIKYNGMVVSDEIISNIVFRLNKAYEEVIENCKNFCVEQYADHLPSTLLEEQYEAFTKKAEEIFLESTWFHGFPIFYFRFYLNNNSNLKDHFRSTLVNWYLSEIFPIKEYEKGAYGLCGGLNILLGKLRKIYEDLKRLLGRYNAVWHASVDRLLDKNRKNQLLSKCVGDMYLHVQCIQKYQERIHQYNTLFRVFMTDFYWKHYPEGSFGYKVATSHVLKEGAGYNKVTDRIAMLNCEIAKTIQQVKDIYLIKLFDEALPRSDIFNP